MFYESERIIHKNQKYEKSRAYAIISDLTNKGLSIQEQIEAINILLNSENNEFQTSVLERAKAILEAQVENGNEEKLDQINTDNSCDFSVCPVLSYT